MTENAALRAAFDAARAAHLAEPNPPRALRKDRLKRLEAALEAYGDRLVKAMSEDFSHRSEAESSSFDVTIPIGDVRHNRRKLGKWMRPRRAGMPMHLLPARGRIIPQPKGVVGVISPWNFPVYLATAPIAAALAAGNRVLLKPSELSPATSEVLAEMLGGAFEATEVSVHTGGPELAAAFSKLPFNHLFFTGSTAVGRKVAAAAAENLTPITLELGGKSPAIVGQAGDLSRAAERIGYGKTANAGQICVAPDYAMVPRGQMRPFADEVAAVWQRFYPEGIASDDYTAIVSDRHRTRLEEMLSEAEDAGAEVIRVGDAPTNSRKMAPALVLDPPRDIRLMQEEIFGPILPVLPYDTAAEARAYVAEGPSPLALYVFTDDPGERDDWLHQSLSGGVSVNETLFHVAADTLPFGGVGESGVGAYHGQAGFDTFSHLKSVLYQPKINGGALFTPPITGAKAKAMATLRKII